MKIHETEILDGLAIALNDSAISILCPVVRSPSKVKITDEVKEATASLEEDDLYPITSVLVSDGWNLNDDVFLASDLWEARNTPVNKPINIQHVSADVIGHMTQSQIITQDGMVIASQEELKNNIDIIVGGVIYKSWTDKEQRATVAKIIDAIERNEKFVSMECHFSGFDYAIKTPEGEHKYIERTSESAFLTKHLKAYGGNGEYEGYRVGRLLRDYRFIGKGIVDTPGNPRSVILASSKTFDPTKANQFFTCAEVKMDHTKDLEVANAEIARLKAELTSAKNASDTIQAKLDEAQSKIDSITAEKETVATELDTVKANLETANTELNSVKAEKETLQADFTKAAEERDALKTDVRNGKRIAALKDKGLEDAKIESVMASFNEADDAIFEAAVALIDKKEDKKEDMKEDPKKAKAKEDEDMDDEECSKKDAKADVKAEDLENVEDESKAELTNPSTSESLVSYASAYFRSALKTTPKKEEK
jgi:myosin heavy subunit